MQTFLPHADFAATARALDRLRLGKQRLEVIQVLRALLGLTTGWRNHPAVHMWRGHEQLLGAYGVAICDEWIARGYRDTSRPTIIELSGYDPATPVEQLSAPGWLGDPEAHERWQSLLIQKNAAHYQPLFPDARGDLPFDFPAPEPPTEGDAHDGD